MLGTIFNFTGLAKNSIVKLLTVKSDVVTFFSGKKQNFYNTDHTLGQWTATAKQCNPGCTGTPYKAIQEHEPLHKLGDPHTNAAERELEHIHLQQCAIVTPDDFSCLLDQIVKFQKDPVLRTKTLQKASAVNRFLKLEYKVDLEHDYLSPADVAAAKKNYAEFYNKHKDAIAQQYKHVQDELSWSDEFRELGTNFVNAALASGLYSGGLAFVEEGLKAYGVSSENIKRFTYGVTTAMAAIGTVTTATWVPIVTAVTINAACHWLKAGAKETQMANSIALTLNTVVRHLPTNAYGALNLAVALLGSISGSYVGSLSRTLSQSFWKYCWGSNTKQAVSQTEVMATKLSHS